MSRGSWLLWGGAALGLSLSLGSLLSGPARAPKPSLPLAGAVPEGAVALVNGEAISKTAYDSLLANLRVSEGREPPEAEKHLVLDRLIEEELMLEHAQNLGLVRSDPTARHALLSAVYALERGPGEAQVPSDTELRTLYQRFLNERRSEPDASPAPSFEEARGVLLTQYREEAADRAFAQKVKALRGAAEVRVAEGSL